MTMLKTKKTMNYSKEFKCTLTEDKSLQKKKKVIELMKDKQMLYLIFRKFNDNYYIANHISTLPENRTPADSLVCETYVTSTQVENDKLLLHELPKKLPDYVIEGFKKRLSDDTKRSLVKDYKEFEESSCSFWELEDDVMLVTSVFLEAKNPLLDLVNSLTNIEDFFRFAILLQEHGAIKIYLQDMWKVKA